MNKGQLGKKAHLSELGASSRHRLFAAISMIFIAVIIVAVGAPKEVRQLFMVHYWDEDFGLLFALYTTALIGCFGSYLFLQMDKLSISAGFFACAGVVELTLLTKFFMGLMSAFFGIKIQLFGSLDWLLAAWLLTSVFIMQADSFGLRHSILVAIGYSFAGIVLAVQLLLPMSL